MRVTVSEEMKTWVMNYIRTHRNEGCISLHVVFSNFNFEFGKKFRTDPRVAVGLMIESGFLRGKKARKGFSIWLPEDEGKGRARPFRSRLAPITTSIQQVVAKSADAPLTTEVQIQPEALAEQKGEIEMPDANIADAEEKVPYLISTINPETGKSDDLIATARVATKLLHAKGQVDSDGRCLAVISPEKILSEAGFTTSVPHLIIFLDRIGLVRKLNKVVDTYRYLVLDPDFFDLIVTPESVTAVLKQMQERRQLQWDSSALKKLRHPETGELTGLRARIAELESELAMLKAKSLEAQTSESVFGGPTLEQLAEAAVIVEDLVKERDKALSEVGALRNLTESLQEQVADLERKLKEQSTADDLMSKIRANAKK